MLEFPELSETASRLVEEFNEENLRDASIIVSMLDTLPDSVVDRVTKEKIFDAFKKHNLSNILLSWG